MQHDRMMQAIERIERALSRLEAAKLLQTSSSDAHSDIEQRHERLKSETRTALNQIDKLLAGMEG
jgi:hypothetical protein